MLIPLLQPAFFASLASVRPMPADARAIYVDVPFVAQTGDGCGAACISMVMQFWDAQSRSTPPSGHLYPEIFEALYSKAARGIIARDMVRYLETQGFRAFTFEGDRQMLRQHLAKGRPLIACISKNPEKLPLHYVVVTGIDAERGFVLLNDPAQRKLAKVVQGDFEKAWRAAGNWTLLALP